MSDDTQAVSTPNTEVEAAAPDAVTATSDAQPSAPIVAESVDQLPEWAQKLINDTRAEAAKHRTEKAEAKRLAEEKRLADEGKWKELYEAEKANAAAAKLDILRMQVASAKKLPEVLVSRLTGSTREELEADADLLLQAIPAAPKFSTTDGANGVNQAPPVKSRFASEAERIEQATRLGVNPQFYK